MKVLTISFLGLGTIGTQLLRYIDREKGKIKKQYQVEIRIGKILVKDLSKERNINVSGFTLTDNPAKVFENADIMIECMGGNATKLTKDLVLAAIEHKKSVIMSSKKCLALYGKEIMKAVSDHQVLFQYDATVGGGIPVSIVLENVGKCEEIEKIYGICNATSNYILSCLTREKTDFKTALQKAKKNGYAENDAEEDIEGYDTLYKAIILAGMGMNEWIDCNEIKPITIRGIKKAAGMIIKPYFCIERIEGKLQITIEPKTFAKDSLLANVNENNNVIIICGSESGERAYVGQGAGAKPTASSMFDDLMKVIRLQ